MTTDELRRAITQPAVQAGCTLETALVAHLIADATGEPGVLPHVSHALLETWRRRRGNTLTLASYHESTADDTDVVAGMAFSGDGRTLVTTGADLTLRRWDSDVERVATGVCAVAFSLLSEADWDWYFPGLPYQPP